MQQLTYILHITFTLPAPATTSRLTYYSDIDFTHVQLCVWVHTRCKYNSFTFFMSSFSATLCDFIANFFVLFYCNLKCLNNCVSPTPAILYCIKTIQVNLEFCHHFYILKKSLWLQYGLFFTHLFLNFNVNCSWRLAQDSGVIIIELI